jgi:hypothetical protein
MSFSSHDELRDRVSCLMATIRRHEDGSGLCPDLRDLNNDPRLEDAVPLTPSVVDLSQKENVGVALLDVAVPAVIAPSQQEMLDALRLGESVDYSNSQDCFRVLIHQNIVLLREAIHRKSHLPLAIGSGSLGSSLLSPVSYPSLRASPARAQGISKRSRPGSNSASPPKCFQCPLCLQFCNEKDFDRHVLNWIEKSQQTGVIRAGCCGGIRDHDHPLLHRFPGLHHVDRVTALVNHIRSLLHPGAYDSLSAQGSGRHVVVAQHFELLARVQ